LNQQLHARDLASVIFLAFLIWQEYNLWQFFFQSPDFALMLCFALFVFWPIFGMGIQHQ